MSKYGQSLGVWELKVGGADLKLVPTADDLLDFRNLMTDGNSKGNIKERLRMFEEFIYKIIKRDVPPIDDKEDKELKFYVRLNVNDLFDETMVVFKWTTKEELEEQKNKMKEVVGEKAKNLI